MGLGTFVVHVSGQLHVAHGGVHQLVAEVCVGLQDKLCPELHIVALLVSLVDQHRVVIVELGEEEADRKELDRV